ncbi:MAG: hypothetical protein AB7F88_05125 [Pyrinomonadaceae bacterium]
MKTIFRLSGWAVLATALGAFGASSAFGQDQSCADTDGQLDLYTKITTNYRSKNPPEMKIALTAGKEFLEKYGSCEPLKPQLDFIRPQVARLEKDIPVREKEIEMGPLYKRYDAALAADNPDEILAAGKAILAKEPGDLNIMVPIAFVTGDKSTSANSYKYADDAIQFAGNVLTKLKAGAELNRTNAKGEPAVGVLKYTFTREVAIPELTYIIAYLKYYGKKDKQGAIPLYYELTKAPGRFKTDPRVFATIGSYYIDESEPIATEIQKLIADLRGATTDEDKERIAETIKPKVALYNGYVERAIDAYGRAHSVAKSDTASAKSAKDGLYTTLQQLYERRFPEKKEGLDTFVAAAISKPMPDPTSAVQPVSDPEPATTTTTTTGAVPAAGAAKPAAANGKTAVTTKPKK